MTKITQRKEWEQYDAHKFVGKKTSEDKAYQIFLNSITDEDGKLYVLGVNDYIDPVDPKKNKITPVPEEIIELCRVLDPMNDNKEYLVYDIIQWGYFEDGTKSPMIHIQDVGTWRKFEWVRKALPQGINMGDPQPRRQFKEVPESSEVQFDIPFTLENVENAKKKKAKDCRLYIYDLSKSGRGGKDGKIGVDNWDDFTNRSFKELFDGTYLLKTQLEQEIRAAKQKQIYLDMEKKSLDIKNK